MKKVSLTFTIWLFISIVGIGIPKLVNIRASGKVMPNRRGATESFKAEMAKLIKFIRVNSPDDFFIIQQNATSLYFDEDGSNASWLDNVDGVSQESIEYGDPEYGMRTPPGRVSELFRRLRTIKSRGKAVFTTNYVGPFFKPRRGDQAGFVNYNVPNRNVTGINERIVNMNPNSINNLNEVKNFMYLLNPENFRSKEEYLLKIESLDFDLLVIDGYFDGEFLESADLERMKKKKNGNRRLVVCYFSIGEAEDYREYWEGAWNSNPPHFLETENDYWEGNYRVLYWNSEWKTIVKGYQDRITESGFDGVFLDTIDTFHYFEGEE